MSDERFIELIKEVNALKASGDMEAALNCISSNEDALSIPSLLLLKGMLIQLTERGSYEISDAEDAFLAALRIDHEYIPAHIELAWLYLNVYNDASRALPLFNEALNLCRSHIIELCEGIFRSRLEIEGNDMAVHELHVILDKLADDGKNVLTSLKKWSE